MLLSWIGAAEEDPTLLNTENNHPTYVMPWLRKIIGGDAPGLGDEGASPDVNAKAITWSPPDMSSLAYSFLKPVIDHPAPVYIKCVRSAAKIPDVMLGPVDIIKHQSYFQVTWLSIDPPKFQPPYFIWIDAYCCNSADYQVITAVDARGTPTAYDLSPPYLALFHEIGHAFLTLHGVSYLDPRQEGQAILVENALRRRDHYQPRSPIYTEQQVCRSSGSGSLLKTSDGGCYVPSGC